MQQQHRQINLRLTEEYTRSFFACVHVEATFTSNSQFPFIITETVVQVFPPLLIEEQMIAAAGHSY